MLFCVDLWQVVFCLLNFVYSASGSSSCRCCDEGLAQDVNVQVRHVFCFVLRVFPYNVILIFASLKRFLLYWSLTKSRSSLQVFIFCISPS